MKSGNMFAVPKEKEAGWFGPDPRTKLALLLTISMVIVLGGNGVALWAVKWILVFCPFFGLICANRKRGALFYMAVYLASTFSSLWMLPYIHGAWNSILVMFCVIFSRMMPGIAMGWYLMVSTTVSEFLAALEHMHISSKIAIPLSVIFRFLPTVKEEYQAINDAMRMRGIRLGGGRAGDMLEYRVIPLMICSVKIGEELSAAALTRGLGAPVKRTNACHIRIRVLDVLLLCICMVSFVLLILEKVRWI